MKNKVLILAPFPNERYKVDGMISRIKHIDNLLIDVERIYLYVSFFKNSNKVFFKEVNAEVYELNIFIHFASIIRLLFDSDRIYIHSIYQIRHIWYLIPFYKKHIYLDAHGIVPEEIKFFGGSTLNYYFMSFVERLIFKKDNLTVICVTNKMISHFRLKYKSFKGNYLLNNIFPSQLKDIKLDSELNSEFNSQITVIYSGSCAQWQQIDLMLSLIKMNLLYNYKFIILSTNVQEFLEHMKVKKIPFEKIEVKSVKPEELFSYYNLADYGFILRDNNIVNKVANPTKMIEYLSFGITPIVMNSDIGDYTTYGYEYITLDQFCSNSNLKKGKSLKNISIAKKMAEENLKIDLLNEFSREVKQW